jgi:hypothetical protein
MSDDDLAYKQELLEALKKQLREREFFAAELGVSADPVISKEINKIRVRITNIEQELESLFILHRAFHPGLTMSADEVEDEIAHQRELVREYKTHLRVLETQAAKYGLLAPPHIQTEIDRIKKSIQNCTLNIKTIKDDFVSQKSREYMHLSSELDNAYINRYSTDVIPLRMQTKPHF